jgi:hypothetical protein
MTRSLFTHRSLLSLAGLVSLFLAGPSLAQFPRPLPPPTPARLPSLPPIVGWGGYPGTVPYQPDLSRIPSPARRPAMSPRVVPTPPSPRVGLPAPSPRVPNPPIPMLRRMEREQQRHQSVMDAIRLIK